VAELIAERARFCGQTATTLKILSPVEKQKKQGITLWLGFVNWCWQSQRLRRCHPAWRTR
jgi:hypothetical protein